MQAAAHIPYIQKLKELANEANEAVLKVIRAAQYDPEKESTNISKELHERLWAQLQLSILLSQHAESTYRWLTDISENTDDFIQPSSTEDDSATHTKEILQIHEQLNSIGQHNDLNNLISELDQLLLHYNNISEPLQTNEQHIKKGQLTTSQHFTKQIQIHKPQQSDKTDINVISNETAWNVIFNHLPTDRQTIVLFLYGRNEDVDKTATKDFNTFKTDDKTSKYNFLISTYTDKLPKTEQIEPITYQVHNKGIIDKNTGKTIINLQAQLIRERTERTAH